MKALYVVVEGHGDELAAQNLVTRLWQDLALPAIPWRSPIRGLGLTTERGVRRACAIVRSKGDASAMLVLRDEDDLCPRNVAPLTAGILAGERLPFAASIVLLHREFETLFLPCLPGMAGRPLKYGGVVRPGIKSGAQFTGDPQAKRGVKEWLAANAAVNRSYKPTLDQLPMTRMLDFAVLRTSALPCFGTLERSLQFLSESRGKSAVYPPPTVP